MYLSYGLSFLGCYFTSNQRIQMYTKSPFPYKLILESHVILYCFDRFKKLRLFVYVLNLKIDVVLNASHAVVISWFSLNEAPLGLFKFISDYLPYFEKINIFFNIITKKFELIYKDWSKLFVRFIRNNLNQVLHTLA
jgi:hypothetical protein